MSARLGNRLRAGFVLPMALVATAVTLLIVGASARYCTTSMSTSSEYLGRSRCRLVAQSALELARDRLAVSCAGKNLSIPDASSVSYGADLDEIGRAVVEELNGNGVWSLRRNLPGLDDSFRAAVDFQKGVDGIYRLTATVSCNEGTHKVSVSLQEGIVVPLVSNDLFSYAYFANGDGHLTSRNLTVNGDVRSNRDFYITGAEINGYIYASNQIQIARSDAKGLKDWFDERDVQIRTGASYDSNYRDKTFAKVRPTNPLPLNGGAEWPCGFDGVDEKKARNRQSLLSAIVRAMLGIKDDNGTADVKAGLKSKYEDRPIVNAEFGGLQMPRIVSNSESTSSTDRHLSDYKSYANRAKTIKNNSGGSLVCSNCFINANGEIEQISARLKLNAKDIVDYHLTGDGETHWDEDRVKEYGGRNQPTSISTSGSRLPPNSIPVYDYEVMSLLEAGLRSIFGQTPSRDKLNRLTDKSGYLKSSSSSSGELIWTSELKTVAAGAGVDESEVRKYLESMGWKYENQVERNVGSIAYPKYYWMAEDSAACLRIQTEEGLSLTYTYSENSGKGAYTDDQDEKVPAGKIPIYAYTTTEPSDSENWEKYTKPSRTSQQEMWYRQGDSGYCVVESDAKTVVNDSVGWSNPWNDLQASCRDAFTKAGWAVETRPTAWRSKLAKGHVSFEAGRSRKNIFSSYTYSFTLGEVKHINQHPELKLTAEEKMILATFIPVYAYKSSLGWGDSSADYGQVSGKDGRLQKDDERFILEQELGQVAAKVEARESAARGAQAVRAEDVKSLFDTDDSWIARGQNGYSGYASLDPVGYFVINTSDITLSGEGAVGYSYVKVEDLKETIERIKSVAPPTSEDYSKTNAVSPQVITRQLRRIFVRAGYYVDTDSRLRQKTAAGAAVPLAEDPDMVLTRNENDEVGEVLASGSTTAALRPFRENGGESSAADVSGLPNDSRGGVPTGRRIVQPHPNAMCDADKGAVILIGTWDFPITIDGPVVFESDVLIRGVVSGRGTIYSGRNIHVIGDITYKNPPYWPKDRGANPDSAGKDMLVLISRGSIVIGNYVKDEMWSTDSKSLLKDHFIDGQEPNDKHTWVYKLLHRGNVRAPYSEFDYTQSDTIGGQVYKVDYQPGSGDLRKTPAKYYESVLGDWVFTAFDEPLKTTASDEDRILNSSPYCECRFSQHWDCHPADLTDNGLFAKYACYQGGLIELFFQSKNWGEAQRQGWSAVAFKNQKGRSGSDFFSTYRNDYANDFCKTKFHQARWDRRPHLGIIPDTKQRIDGIHEINAVLYSSMGVFGVVGGEKTMFTLNGALYARDEVIVPFARHRRLFWSDTDDIYITINWDIRLNPKSGDSIHNHEVNIDPPIEGLDDGDEGRAVSPRIFFWQEVPTADPDF